MAKNTVIAANGEKYGRLTVIKSTDFKKDGHKYNLCICDCGTQKHVLNSNMVKGKTKSCGCLSRETTSKLKRSHGMSNTKIYATWNRMWNRCTNPVVDRYPRYGGRGISVCKRWKNFESFYEDMGDIPSPRHSIGRIDNDLGYYPENCRWETPEDQGANTSRTVFIEHEGQVKSASQWARHLSASYSKIISRYSSGIRSPEIFECLSGSLRDSPVTVSGKTKLTTDWMKIASIPISSFYLCLRNGMTREQVVEKYLQRKG